jgi:AraC-like DNA-binding protein/mannose-6-phosphate isomerase-like protein (cupin superfamily)
MSATETVADTHIEAVNEDVVYQNPLLFLKIWEIASDSDQYGIPERWLWHYHKEVEFLAIVEGGLGIQSKQGYNVLRPGDVMVLGASQPHRTHKALPGPLRYIVFQVDLTRHFDQSTMPYLHCFSELTRPLELLNYIFAQNNAAKREAYATILEIFQETQSRLRGYEIAVSSLIKRLLLLLLRNDNEHMLSHAEENGLARLRPVLEFVNARLSEKIAVEDACSLVNVSYHYFIKYFKKVMGVSFVDYVNYQRIKKAERLLLTSDLSILEVGYAVGIANMAQFYKLFKRHNQCSPREFKLQASRELG